VGDDVTDGLRAFDAGLVQASRVDGGEQRVKVCAGGGEPVEELLPVHSDLHEGGRARALTLYEGKREGGGLVGRKGAACGQG
jgi:hypothetical protein